MSSAIKLLTFDLDDTLWPVEPTIIAAEDRLFNWMQQHVPEITSRYDVLTLREKRYDFLKQRPDLAHDMSLFRIESLKALAKELNIDTDWVDEAFEVFYHARQQVELFPDVRPVLETLSSEYTLVAVTNGNADIQLTGLGSWFDFSVSSADVGKKKPHPEVFETALNLARALPQETVHIGDDEHHDIFGAAEAGIRTVWLNRSDRDWQHTECEADFHIRSLAELPDILQQMQYNAGSRE